MNRARVGVALAVLSLLATAGIARADVKAQERTQIKFEGMLGRMMNLFGGKGAREGQIQTIAVKGDRKAVLQGDSGTIVDLAEERVYEVDFKGKSYKVVTFAEMRQRLAEAQAKGEENARRSETRQKQDSGGKEMEVDFSVKSTGETREINGFACRQAVVTIAVHEKGKTLEQAGGMLMTADTWLAPRIAAMKEATDFDIRYAKKMAAGLDPSSAADMAQAVAMYPGLREAMGRFQAEKGALDGTPILTVTTVQTVSTPEQAEQAKKQDEDKSAAPGGAIGGLLGRFGRKKADDSKDKEQTAPKAVPGNPNATTFMTSTTEVLSVSASVTPADVQIPAGFKQK